jgi:hypothetical protein
VVTPSSWASDMQEHKKKNKKQNNKNYYKCQKWDLLSLYLITSAL